MIDFKYCTHWQKAMKEEHCPFQCVCNDDCYFTLKLVQEDNEKLLAEIDELQYQINNNSDYEEELIDKEREVEDLEDIIEQFRNFIVDLTQDVSSKLILEKLIEYPIGEHFYRISDKIKERENKNG